MSARDPTATTLSRSIFRNAHTFAKVLDGYSPRNQALGVVFPPALTVLPTLVNAFVPGAGRGLWIAIPWGLALLHAPLYLLSGRLLRARREGAFQASYWVQSMVQFLWLQFLCWYTVPLFSIIGVTVFCTWAFNDARVFYDSRPTRAQYLLAFPVFDALLLLVDAVGHHGLWHLHRSDPGTLRLLLAVQFVLAVIAQLIVHFVGSESYAHDQRMVEHAALEREVAVMAAERDVLRQTNVYLGHGLAASKFSHDVASPVTVIINNVAMLEESIARAPGVDDDARELCDEVMQASHRVLEMTRALAEAIKTPEAPQPRDVRDLIERAVVEMHANLRGHDVTAPEPLLDLEDSDVAVIPGHVGTLANLLTNGALQPPGAPMEVRGRAIDRWFYHLAIRDHGAEPAARDGALARIRRSLSFEPPGAAPAADPGAPRAYRGYGIALMMAKVLLVRHNGCLDAAAPREGRGVVFHVILPRTPPRDIPDAVNLPEAALDRALAP